jgi:hypothetical protein
MKQMIRIGLVLCVALAAPAAASAHTLLTELFLKAVLSDVQLAPPTGPFSSHEAHFQPVLRPGEVAPGFEVNQLQIPLAINSIIASQVSTIPLGSSSGGFAYTYDSALGTFSRQSSTFGSAFAERALSAGRGRWNAGINFQRAQYDTLEDKNLQNGDLRVYLVHQDCCGAANTAGAPPDPFFEGDLIGNSVSMKLTSSTLSSFLNYGLTDRLDVGIVVPLVTVSMDLDVRARIIGFATTVRPSTYFPAANRATIPITDARASATSCESTGFRRGWRRTRHRHGPSPADRRWTNCSHGRDTDEAVADRIDVGGEVPHPSGHIVERGGGRCRARREPSVADG